jgi:hypothetical protein
LSRSRVLHSSYRSRQRVGDPHVTAHVAHLCRPSLRRRGCIAAQASAIFLSQSGSPHRPIRHGNQARTHTRPLVQQPLPFSHLHTLTVALAGQTGPRPPTVSYDCQQSSLLRLPINHPLAFSPQHHMHFETSSWHASDSFLIYTVLDKENSPASTHAPLRRVSTQRTCSSFCLGISTMSQHHFQHTYVL